jgi:hypothetical protein
MNKQTNKTPYLTFIVVMCLILAGCLGGSGGGAEAALPVDSVGSSGTTATNSVGSSGTTATNSVGSSGTTATNSAGTGDTVNVEDSKNMNKDEMIKKGESMGMSMEDMMNMGESMGMSMEDMMNMGGSTPASHNDPSTEQAPKLKNLMLQNLGPWDPSSATFGDLKFNARYSKTVFDDFGMLHNPGQANQYDNPTFEFKAPADTVVISPVSGVVTMITWQPTTNYKQDDWDIIIQPSKNSKWGINLDHLVSIDCDRSGVNPVTCDLPLTISNGKNSEVVKEGTVIEAGQVLGYVGNWPDNSNSGINGRTELTLFEYVREGTNKDQNYGVINHCPTMHLDESVELVYKSKIQDLMSSYETWSGDSSSYPQGQMVSPGCRYSAIKESSNGVTEPVTS